MKTLLLKSLTLFFILGFLTTNIVFSQGWFKNYGYGNHNNHFLNNVSDGNYILVTTVIDTANQIDTIYFPNNPFGPDTIISIDTTSILEKNALLKITPLGDIIWSKGYDIYSSNRHFTHVLETKDQGFVISEKGVGVKKAGKMGNMIWEFSINDFDRPIGLVENEDSSVVVGSSIRGLKPPYHSKLSLTCVDNHGVQLWKNITDSSGWRANKLIKSGSEIIVVSDSIIYDSSSWSYSPGSARLDKYSFQGNLLSSEVYSQIEGKEVCISGDGGYVIGGGKIGGILDKNKNSLLKVDSVGGVVWFNSYTETNPMSSLGYDSTGFVFITNGVIFKTSETGIFQWDKQIYPKRSTGIWLGYSFASNNNIALTDDGYIAGVSYEGTVFRDDKNYKNEFGIIRVDNQGVPQNKFIEVLVYSDKRDCFSPFRKKDRLENVNVLIEGNGFSLLEKTNFRGIVNTNDFDLSPGDYVIKIFPENANLWEHTSCSLDSFAVTIDSKDGPILVTSSIFKHKNEVFGTVYNETNNNCQLDSIELGIPDYIINGKENNTGKVFVAYSGNNGNYALSLDSGSYSIKLVENHPYYELAACANDSIILHLGTAGTFDTVGINFPLKTLVSCPLLNVDISTPFLRRCFDNTYRVKYCNVGSAAAQNSYIEVDFDDYLEITGSSIPWSSVIGNTYRFDLGTIEIGDCGDFKVYTNVNCDSTILGQSHCVEARIYPNEICNVPNSSWDESNIDTDADCDQDSVQFTIENTGLGDMSGPSEYSIVEDNIILVKGNIYLNQGQSAKFSYPANGHTYHLAVEQTADHPFADYSYASIEGCKTSTQATFSTGFLTSLPFDNENPFVAVDCQENIGAYDPNDKTSYPKGVGAGKYITDHDELTYRIRFQNTGSDTAFRVVVKDTLSDKLDIATIQTGVSSHPYEFRIYGNNILEWTFDNILLVDSTTNEPESHGFVKFKIRQAKGNTPGTLIENKVDIYFDFNEPVETNTEFNKVEENFLTVAVTELQSRDHQFRVYPNPFTAYTMINLGETYESVKLEVFSITGALVNEQTYGTAEQLKVDGSDLKEGLYFFTISSNDEVIGSGKMMAR